ncbi:hypothetical protein LVB87_08735 [Lysobacter sp. KIS68-7]|uniref:hypothetical protein n=1 Tax=Lysobacter sp. KIS68-7 TaxID=2904252 RepID=UPI001E2C505C|nr:hypothetical protein [Lysobacter sp. KIS68-7]UHQ18312.1 hypothetical protein LVB87_08735 [Lysobacter sp. KIS68-7]
MNLCDNVSILITSTPPGEAPLWVRQTWVGLSLPLAQTCSHAHTHHTFGVLTRPRTRVGQWFARMFRRTARGSGYLVEAQAAIHLLADVDPVAANWWREHAPHLMQPGQYFLFQVGVAQLAPRRTRPPSPPDLLADITLVSGLVRGRRSGWRPNNDFGLKHLGHTMFNDAHIEFLDCQEVQPGQSARAELWFLAPDLQAGRLRPGFEFTVHDGSPIVVAHGVVISVLRQELLASN